MEKLQNSEMAMQQKNIIIKLLTENLNTNSDSTNSRNRFCQTQQSKAQTRTSFLKTFVQEVSLSKNLSLLPNETGMGEDSTHEAEACTYQYSCPYNPTFSIC